MRSAMLGSDSPGSDTMCIISHTVMMACAAGMLGAMPSSFLSAFAFASRDEPDIVCG